MAPPQLAGHVHEVESAAVAAVVALVMKLTESRFKPLFLRMMEWAAASAHSTDDFGDAGEAEAAAAAAAASVGRQVTLFSVAGALTERLRSVFVPYYRYLLDKAVKHLAAPGGGAASQPKKKQRKQGSEGAAEGGLTSATGAWVLRLRVVRALHRALLYDSAGFFDAEKLERLLQPLVAQLEALPPAEVAPTLSAQCSDAGLDGYITSGKRKGKASAAAAASDGGHLGTHPEAYDTMGVAAVACLVQMGVTANSDVFWKPLNHRVLMCTRGSASVRTRLLALEVVVQLVERLREEYLVLLPEVRGTGGAGTNCLGGEGLEIWVDVCACFLLGHSSVCY